MADGILSPCNVAYGSGIMTLNSPGGSTLQCGTWLWDDMPLSSPKRPPYWNSTFGFHFEYITAVDMSFCTSLRNYIQTRLYAAFPRHDAALPRARGFVDGSQGGFAATHGRGHVTTTINIEIGSPSAEKNDVMSIFKMTVLS